MDRRTAVSAVSGRGSFSPCDGGRAGRLRTVVDGCREPVIRALREVGGGRLNRWSRRAVTTAASGRGGGRGATRQAVGIRRGGGHARATGNSRQAVRAWGSADTAGGTAVVVDGPLAGHRAAAGSGARTSSRTRCGRPPEGPEGACRSGGHRHGGGYTALPRMRWAASSVGGGGTGAGGRDRGCGGVDGPGCPGAAGWWPSMGWRPGPGSGGWWVRVAAQALPVAVLDAWGSGWP
jgi:hypothetical protein